MNSVHTEGRSLYHTIFASIERRINSVRHSLYRYIRGELTGDSTSICFFEGSPYRINEDLK